MRHHTVSRRCWAAVAAVAVVGTACGGDSDPPASNDAAADVAAGEDIAAADVAADETIADVDDRPASGSEAEMTIARLCDPVEAEVLAVLGDAVSSEHNDFYADREDRILDCSWTSDVADHTIRVGYNGAPSATMLGISEGMQDLPAIDAPNVYALSRTDLSAPNGWTITIQNLGADQTDIPDATAAIANAALAAIEA